MALRISRSVPLRLSSFHLSERKLYVLRFWCLPAPYRSLHQPSFSQQRKPRTAVLQSKNQHLQQYMGNGKWFSTRFTDLASLCQSCDQWESMDARHISGRTSPRELTLSTLIGPRLRPQYERRTSVKHPFHPPIRFSDLPIP